MDRRSSAMVTRRTADFVSNKNGRQRALASVSVESGDWRARKGDIGSRRRGELPLVSRMGHHYFWKARNRVPTSDTGNAEEKGILFNRAIHPYQVIPILTQMEQRRNRNMNTGFTISRRSESVRRHKPEIAEWVPWNASAASSNPEFRARELSHHRGSSIAGSIEDCLSLRARHRRTIEDVGASRLLVSYGS